MEFDEEGMGAKDSIFGLRGREDLGDVDMDKDEMIDDSEEPQLPYKLSISEYEEIAQRLESSLKQLELIKDALSSPENFENMRTRVSRECEQLTLRIKLGKKKGELESINQNVVTLKDVGIRGFMLLKHQKKNSMEFMASDCYVADKIKLTLNTKGEVVLLSTSLTVLRSESEDNFTVESLELSQK